MHKIPDIKVFAINKESSQCCNCKLTRSVYATGRGYMIESIHYSFTCKINGIRRFLKKIQKVYSYMDRIHAWIECILGFCAFTKIFNSFVICYRFFFSTPSKITHMGAHANLDYVIHADVVVKNLRVYTLEAESIHQRVICYSYRWYTELSKRYTPESIYHSYGWYTELFRTYTAYITVYPPLHPRPRRCSLVNSRNGGMNQNSSMSELENKPRFHEYFV